MAAGRTKRTPRRDYFFNADDHISILPNDVLLKILDRLPVEEARNTALLARRWKDLWKLLSVVEISDQMEENGKQKVSSFLKSFIRLFQGDKLRRFSVSVKYEGKRRASYKFWMAFAVSHNVEELSLELILDEYNWPRSQHPTVPLPIGLFSCCSLIRVKLTFADLNLLPPIHLKLLRDLHISKSRLPNDGIEIITANYPQLQHLVLSSCNRGQDLNITVSNESTLSRMTIDDTDYSFRRAPNTSINAPNITELEILCSTWKRRYFIVNAPIAVEAKLCFAKMPYLVGQFLNNEITENIAKLLKSLQVAKMIRLCSRCIPAVVTMRQRDLMFTLTHLILDTQLANCEILGIVCLLRACPTLKQLALNFTEAPDMLPLHIPLEKWESQAYSLEGCLQNLAILEFKNLEGSYQTWGDGIFEMAKFFKYENGIQLVKHLLSPCTNLDKIAFMTSQQRCELINCTI